MLDPKVCTCGCGATTSSDWHAWQAGRAYAWADTRPAWWSVVLRWRCVLSDGWWRLRHRAGSVPTRKED